MPIPSDLNILFYLCRKALVSNKKMGNLKLIMGFLYPHAR